jgi:hypothetical protein
MNREISVSIFSEGDPSTGIPDAYWEIGDMFLDDEDREAFKKALEEAFSYVADPIKVTIKDPIGSKQKW